MFDASLQNCCDISDHYLRGGEVADCCPELHPATEDTKYNVVRKLAGITCRCQAITSMLLVTTHIHLIRVRLCLRKLSYDYSLRTLSLLHIDSHICHANFNTTQGVGKHRHELRDQAMSHSNVKLQHKP